MAVVEEQDVEHAEFQEVEGVERTSKMPEELMEHYVLVLEEEETVQEELMLTTDGYRISQHQFHHVFQ